MTEGGGGGGGTCGCLAFGSTGPHKLPGRALCSTHSRCKGFPEGKQLHGMVGLRACANPGKVVRRRQYCMAGWIESLTCG